MRRILHVLFALAVVLTTSGGAWLEAAPQAPMGQMDCCPCGPASPSPDCCPPAGPAGCGLRLPTSATAVAATEVRTSPVRQASRREPRPCGDRLGRDRSADRSSGHRQHAGASAPPFSPPRRQALLSVFRI